MIYLVKLFNDLSNKNDYYYVILQRQWLSLSRCLSFLEQTTPFSCCAFSITITQRAKEDFYLKIIDKIVFAILL